MTRYRHRDGELLVHADDCDSIRAELAGFGYHQDGAAGPVRRFTGTRPVPEVLAGLREPRLVAPNHVFGADRIIWNQLRPMPTTDELTPVPAGAIRRYVGVIDTGIVLHDGRPHPFLGDRVRYEPEDTARVVRDDHGDPVGTAGHGTFVAGVVLKYLPADVGVRMKGVIDEQSGLTEDLAVANAIDDLGAEGVTLINMSFSGETFEDEPPKAIEDALRRLPAETVVVASAGNRGLRQRVYPAGIRFGRTFDGDPDDGRHARVLSIGSTDRTRKVADFSNYGPWIAAYADGVEVLGPYFHPGYPSPPPEAPPFNGYAVWSGTSFSAAIVTGRIAAVMATGKSARDAATEVLKAEDPITVYDVNGSLDVPYVRG
ncbi:S8/S53 family peptidase [Amycolatopsis sp. OK19-0408]|uniref:S8/S53 family peptidase n=1 Tax=Amycolatopsis iheyensis TaxID=2945988 RepID=A0A9X2SPH4_9PSEU|nr:S8/S53 family peptidase [Amycolatopsis iheyensis]MCR6487570.1 S8/S53 family peptidase [Amycolatopsis iheyensis]